MTSAPPPLPDDTAIARIARGLLDHSLPKAEWTHAAHFAAALWLLRHAPAMATPGAMRGIITAYNAATGTANTDTSGYHHTITCASLRAAQAALDEAAGAPLGDVLARIMAGPCGRSDWLLAHWHAETLFSVRARRDWVDPDRATLPFP